MDAMFRQGERSECHARRAAGVLLVCALAALLWTPRAMASVLYRCTARGGEAAYVSNPAGYRACKEIGRWHARAVYTAERREAPPAPRADRHPKVSRGTPPRAVGANPSVLTITPLRGGRAVPVAPAADLLRPVPIVAMQSLASWVLPRLLGVEAAPVRAAPAASAPDPAPATPGSGAAPDAHRAAAMPAPDAHRSPPAGGAMEGTTVPVAPSGRAARTPPRRGAVYRVKQANGTVMYTNIGALAHGRNAKMLFTYVIECYACNVHSKIDWDTVPLHLAAYRGDIVAAAKLTGVDTALLRAVIHAESGFNPRALSYKGAQGLMQLMPGTAFELGVGDAFDPAENISGGARYLAMLLRDYHGDVKLAAAAYNAGANAVAKYDGVPPYAETQVYVKRVALLYARYRKALTRVTTGTTATLAAARAD